MKINLSKSTLIIFTVALVTGLSYLIINKTKLDISNITASEIEKLEPIENSLYPANISKYLQDNISIFFTKYYEAYKNPEFSTDLNLIVNKSDDGFLYVTSQRTGYRYTLRTKENIGAVFLQITHNYAPDIFLSELIQNLQKENGFILKESDTKYGYDFLIKDLNDHYIVVTISPNSNQSYPAFLSMRAYRK